MSSSVPLISLDLGGPLHVKRRSGAELLDIQDGGMAMRFGVILPGGTAPEQLEQAELATSCRDASI